MNFFRKLFGKKKETRHKKEDLVFTDVVLTFKSETQTSADKILTRANDILSRADEVDEGVVSARDSQYSQSIYDRNLSGVLTYEIESASVVECANKLYVGEFIEMTEGRLMLGVRIKNADVFLFQARGELFLSYSMHGESFSVKANIIKANRYDEEFSSVRNSSDPNESSQSELAIPVPSWMHYIVEILLCAEPTRHRRKYGRIKTEWNVYYMLTPVEQNDPTGDNEESSNYSVTKTIDISEGGFKSIVEKQLPDNSRISCVLEVDNYRKSKGTLIGRVIRCIPMIDSIELFEMTVQFIEMDEPARDFLVDCISNIHPGPVNAAAKITIAEGGFEAFIELSPPRNNGSDLSYEALCSQLTCEGITFGIDDEVLKSLSEKPLYNLESVVARGIPPTNGEDAVLIYHVDINPVLAPKEYENGTVDFKEIGLIQRTDKGAVLVEKTPFTRGMSGVCVTGKTVEATPGKDKKLPAGSHTVVNDEGTALLAGMDGYISIIDGRINVVSTFVVDGDVHYETGNISHNGIVIVLGDVRSGFAVNATGDIIIHGTVESASVKAGGSLVVQGGCIGDDNVIEVGLNAACKFIDGGSFDIRGDLKTVYIINSKVKCGGSIDLIGSGIVRNSHIIARTTVNAKCIGSGRTAADNTVIEVGNDPELLSRFVSISKEIEQLGKDIESAEMTIRSLTRMKYQTGLTPEKNQLLDKSKVLIKHFITKHTDLTEEYGNLKGQINELGYGSICVRDTAYEGLRVIIGSCTLVLKDSLLAVKFYRNLEDEVALASLEEC